MKKHDYFALALAVIVLAITLTLSPKLETIADEATITHQRFDIPGLTRNAGNLPEESYPAY